MPNLDCGLCGNPICMALARRILLRAQKPGECKFISKGNLRKIQEIIPKKEVVRKHPHPNVDKDIIEITPCTEDGKVTLETQLKSKVMGNDFYGDFFDQIQLCASLSEVEMFDKMNCSQKMGYALAEIKGKRTHIFKTGKIIMRQADNREDALATFSKISKVLLPARICSGQNMLADCFGGACEYCQRDVCSNLLDILEIGEIGDDGCINMGDLLGDRKSLADEKFSDNFRALDDVVGEIRKIDDELRKGEVCDRQFIKDKIDEILTKINKACIKNILVSENPINTIKALAQYGLGRDLFRARDGFLSQQIKNDGELYERAAELFFNAYDAFERRDIKGSKDVEARYKEFILAWDAKPSSAGVAKIATNGFYISRVLGISVPDVRKSDRSES
ncbi:MAG: (Fe-S)-binding protein [Thermoplasmata archaeon]